MEYPATPDAPPAAALAHFGPVTADLTWRRAPDGFSGAEVWRGERAGVPAVALKGWPAGTELGRVEQVHAWLRQAAHLPFVPAVLAGAGGRTAVRVGSRVWDALRWAPGRPATPPAAAEVRAACAAAAALHRAWPAEPVPRPCPGILARLDILREHRDLYTSPRLPPVEPELDPLLARAAGVVARRADATAAALRPWAARPVEVRPCVRDLRGEHVLFDGGRVTGVVDYGAMAPDSPAVDLARLLGDLAGADPDLFAAGLGAYRAAGGPPGAPDDLVRVLAGTGAVWALLGWLVRLARGRGTRPARPGAVAARLEALLARAEGPEHV
jgi:homoserine kinase type II